MLKVYLRYGTYAGCNIQRKPRKTKNQKKHLLRNTDYKVNSKINNRRTRGTREGAKGKEELFFFRIYYFEIFIMRSYSSPHMVAMLGFIYSTVQYSTIA